MLVQADLRQFPAHSERHEKNAEHVMIEVAHAGCLRRRDPARPCEAAVPCISVICTTAARLRPCQKVRPWPHFWAARIYMKSVPCPAFFRYNDREKNGGAAAVCRAAGAAHHGAKCRRRRPSRGGAVRALFEPVILHYIVCFIVCYIVCPTHFPVNKANSYPEVNPQGRRRRRRRSDGDGGCGDAGSAAAAAATTAQRRQQWR